MDHSHRRHDAVAQLRKQAAPGVEPTHELPFRAVARYMTSSPHSIGSDQVLETAHAMMRDHAIRHLPVLDGGRLAGIVSERDLYFVETLAGVDRREVKVEEAMSQATYCVRPETPVDVVAKEMAERKYGCAVVMEGPNVVGVFTTTDAMRALSQLFERATPRSG